MVGDFFFLFLPVYIICGLLMLLLFRNSNGIVCVWVEKEKKAVEKGACRCARSSCRDATSPAMEFFFFPLNYDGHLIHHLVLLCIYLYVTKYKVKNIYKAKM